LIACHYLTPPMHVAPLRAGCGQECMRLAAAGHTEAGNLPTCVYVLRNQSVDGGIGRKESVEVDHHPVPPQERSWGAGLVDRQSNYFPSVIGGQCDAGIIAGDRSQVLHCPSFFGPRKRVKSLFPFQRRCAHRKTSIADKQSSIAEGYHAIFGPLYPVYFRGQAFLAARQGPQAAAEFQKILDHRGVVVSDPIGALARLQLGRAFVLSGDKTRAKAAYQDFLSLWKDANPEIPILKQAKQEYARLP
jgi:hypothetical protein